MARTESEGMRTILERGGRKAHLFLVALALANAPIIAVVFFQLVARQALIGLLFARFGQVPQLLGGAMQNAVGFGGLFLFRLVPCFAGALEIDDLSHFPWPGRGHRRGGW